jgi:hypothetical protein
MTPKTEADDRKGLIAQAATIGNIMLLTREFGRGNDFVCYDEVLNKKGGVHVIQTFVSVIKSEEAQIKGRTARQGSRGSYCMILEASELEKFNLQKAEIDRMRETSKLYTTIDRERNAYFEKKKTEFTGGADILRPAHLESLAFCKAFHDGRFEEFAEQLLVYNPPPPMSTSSSGKTLVLMDATGSMSGLLDKAKNTVQDMFVRAELVLKENGIESAGCSMQFAVYRNYSSGSKLVAHSGWESSGALLRDFMRDTHPSGGQGREAIEAGLQYANSISHSADSDAPSLSQIVLIGDMPANTRDEVASKRGMYEYNWGDLYREPTFWETEVEHLSAKSIPIHAFYVHERAESNFQEISQRTGGVCGRLDINSSEGAEMLTGVVTRILLDNIGGAELVQAYDVKFGFVAA